MPAPVVIFSYNRVELLKCTINSLLKNELASETDLYIFSDGPRDEHDLNSVNQVRKYVHSVSGFNNVYVVSRDKNYGLARNIVDGVSALLERFPSVIVLEDDIITSPYFLRFMNNALEMYIDDDKVCQISGYSYLEGFKDDFRLDDIYFVRGADCLAWATWRRAWLNYNSDAAVLYNQIQKRGLVRDFNRDNSYNYFKMLGMTARGKTVSWAVNWYAVNFLAERYVLYPLKSLALHIGSDDMATNYRYLGSADPYCVPLANAPIPVRKILVSETENTTKAFNMFLVRARGPFFVRLSAFFKKKYKYFLNNLKSCFLSR